MALWTRFRNLNRKKPKVTVTNIPPTILPKPRTSSPPASPKKVTPTKSSGGGGGGGGSGNPFIDNYVSPGGTYLYNGQYYSYPAGTAPPGAIYIPSSNTVPRTTSPGGGGGGSQPPTGGSLPPPPEGIIPITEEGEILGTSPLETAQKIKASKQNIPSSKYRQLLGHYVYKGKMYSGGDVLKAQRKSIGSTQIKEQTFEVTPGGITEPSYFEKRQTGFFTPKGTEKIIPITDIFYVNPKDSTSRIATAEEKSYYREQTNTLQASNENKSFLSKVVKPFVAGYSWANEKLQKRITEPVFANLEKVGVTSEVIASSSVDPWNVNIGVNKPLKEFQEGMVVGTLEDIRYNPAKQAVLFGAGAGIGAGVSSTVRVASKVSPLLGKATQGIFTLGGIGLTGAFAVSEGSKIITAPSPKEAGKVFGVAGKDITLLGIGSGLGVKGERFFFEKIERVTPLRKIKTPESTELATTEIWNGKEIKKSSYIITGEKTPPRQKIVTTQFREKFGLKPLKDYTIPARPFKIFTNKPAVNQNPFQVIEFNPRKGKVGKLFTIKGDSEFINPRIQWNEFSPVEKFLVQRLGERFTFGTPIKMDKGVGSARNFFQRGTELSKGFVESKKTFKLKPSENVAEVYPFGRKRVLSELVTKMDVVEDSNLIRISKGETVFKDISLPNAKAYGKTPSLKQTLIEIKEPIIKSKSSNVKFIQPADIKKTSLDSTFSQPQINKQVQQTKLLPKILPQTYGMNKIARVQGGQISTTNKVSKYYGTGLYERTEGGLFPQTTMKVNLQPTKNVNSQITGLGISSELKTQVGTKNMFNLKELLKLDSSLKNKQVIKNVSVTKNKQAMKLSAVLKTKQALKTKQIIKPKPAFKNPPPPTIFRTPPTNRSFRPIGLPFLRLGGKPLFGLLKKRKRKPISRSPSLFAIGRGIKSTSTGSFESSGLTIRPIITPRKKKKLKGGRKK